MSASLKYKRILLKLSGETLMGKELKFGISPKMLRHYGEQIKGLVEMGVQVAIVIGGGNIFPGLTCGILWYRKGAGRLHGHACHGH